MICPKCNFEQPDGQEQCLRCMVIFAKLHPVPSNDTGPSAVFSFYEDEQPVQAEKDTPVEVSRFTLAGYFVVWLGLAVWGVKFILTPISGESFSQSYMHLVNLPFHEAGHILFSPFGRFLQVLGGTLGQWLIPLVVTTYFWFRNDRFAASVGLWWLGQSFMDIAPYMDDARAGQLMLLGGVTGSEVEDYHDWEIILSQLGMMKYDHLIARISFGCGAILIIVSLAWGGWRLYSMARPTGKNPSPLAGEG